MTFDEDFPGLNGFSAANLWRMTNFYEAYRVNEKTRTACVRNWLSYNITNLERCRDDQEREFYIRSCWKYGWTRNVLVHQIGEPHLWTNT
jgi:DUF1016 N-terminal domain